MSTISGRTEQPVWHGFADWSMSPDWSELMNRFETVAPWPSRGRTLRLEVHREHDRYTLRAELPGIDPARDIAVTVSDGYLTITADQVERRSNGKQYGARRRTARACVPLPPTAMDAEIVADYLDGVLTVRIPVSGDAPHGRRVPVATGRPDANRS